MAGSLWHFSRGHIEVKHKDKVFWENKAELALETNPTNSVFQRYANSIVKFGDSLFCCYF